jgi:tRNA(adenine34) deaminase
MFQNKFMKKALDIASIAYLSGEVPVGAVIVDSNTDEIISYAHNQCESLKMPINHAEFLALQEAAKKLDSKYLNDCDLYVTLEPCAFCASAISMFRIRRLFYAANDPKQGAVESASNFFNQKNCFYKPEIYSGINSEEASIMLKKFFLSIRNKNSEKH